jgi:hypothetical protein
MTERLMESNYHNRESSSSFCHDFVPVNMISISSSTRTQFLKGTFGLEARSMVSALDQVSILSFEARLTLAIPIGDADSAVAGAIANCVAGD